MSLSKRPLPGPEDYSDCPAADSNKIDQLDEQSSGTQRLSPDTARLLGLDRVYETLDGSEKQTLLPTPEIRKAFDNIDTSTMPRKHRIREKQGIVAELLRHKVIGYELLRDNFTVYLGSGTDVEYPLALGSRKIILVDPLFHSSDAVKEVLGRIQKITDVEPKLLGSLGRHWFTLSFDFGQGPENVSVNLDTAVVGREHTEVAPEGFSAFHPPEKIGLILTFASQGPAGPIDISNDLTSRLVAGGAILSDNCLTRINPRTKEKEVLKLGRQH